MSDTAYVASKPPCDVCGAEAEYDAKLRGRGWANLCQADFDEYADGRLGTGYGQRLVVGP